MQLAHTYKWSRSRSKRQGVRWSTRPPQWRPGGRSTLARHQAGGQVPPSRRKPTNTYRGGGSAHQLHPVGASCRTPVTVTPLCAPQTEKHHQWGTRRRDQLSMDKPQMQLGPKGRRQHGRTAERVRHISLYNNPQSDARQRGLQCDICHHSGGANPRHPLICKAWQRVFKVSLCNGTDDSGYGCGKVTTCVPSHPADRQQ